MLKPLRQRGILGTLLLAWLGECLQKTYHRQRELTGGGRFVIAKARVKQAEGITYQGAVGQHEARPRGGQKQRFAIAAASRTAWPKQGDADIACHQLPGDHADGAIQVWPLEQVLLFQER